MAKRKDSKPKAKQDTAQRRPGAPEAAEAATAAAEAEAAAKQAEAAAEEDPVARLEAEIASLKDQLLRALAETENLRRRSQREREDVAKYAAAPLIKDLLAVADNLRRALDSVPAEAAEDNEQLGTLLTGIALTEKELTAVFERHHIVKIDPLGERLDPHFHEAMFEIPDPDKPAGTVLQVIQAGYRLRDRLLRPAQVGVAKGGPAATPAAERDEGEPTGTTGPEGDGAGQAGPPNGAGAGDDGGSKLGGRVDTTA
ncbi:MAG: nucleotide exchange factor GrpE [Kiloniellaceae bacterium]